MNYFRHPLIHCAFGLLLTVPLVFTSSGCEKCKSSYDYDKRITSLETSFKKLGKINAETQKLAIREVSRGAEAFETQRRAICLAKKDGTYTKEEAAEQLDALLAHAKVFDDMLAKLEHAPDVATANAALKGVLDAATPDGTDSTDSIADFSLSLTVQAKAPGASAFSVAENGAGLSSGTQVRFEIETTAPAYRYVYQVDSKGKVSLLLPNMGVASSFEKAEGIVSMPPEAEASITLNTEDIGTEEVHVVASLTQLTDFADLVEKASGSDDLNCAAARGFDITATPGDEACPATRGFVVEVPGTSASVINEATDDTVHLVWSFQHLAGATPAPAAEPTEEPKP